MTVRRTTDHRSPIARTLLVCSLAAAFAACSDSDSGGTDPGDASGDGGVVDADATDDVSSGDALDDSSADASDDTTRDDGSDTGGDLADASDSHGDDVTNADVDASDAEDAVAPGPVTEFTAVSTVGGVALSWTNPDDADLGQVLILRSSDDFPSLGGGDETVYMSAGESFVDVVSPGTYYYSAYAGDTSANYSERVTASADAYLDLTGAVDTTYGTDGYTIRTDGGGGNNDVSVSAGAVDSMGRLVVVGFVYAPSEEPGNNADLAVWRLLPGGAPDDEFGDGGLFTLGDDAIDENGTSVAVDDSGITVFGYTGQLTSQGSEQDGALWRLTTGGALDESFNASRTPGVIDLTTSATTAFGCVAHDASGNILVAFSEDDPSDNGGDSDTEDDVLVRRYSSTGSIDSDGFGTGGTLVLHDGAGGGGPDLVQTCLIDSAGNLLVGGRSDATVGVGTNYAAAVWRITPAGALDEAFYEDGVFADNLTPFADFPYAMAIVPSTGELVLVGVADREYAVWWLDGESSTSFDDSGFFEGTGAARHRAFGVFPDPDGGIVVAGRARSGSTADAPFVTRFDAGHVQDSDFGTGGYFGPGDPDEQGWGFDNHPPDAVVVDDLGFITYVGSCKLAQGLCATRIE